jgi:hypothetical protein
VNPASPEVALTPQSMAHLAQARRWARVVASFGFVCAAFLLLGMAGIAAAPAMPQVPKATVVVTLVIGLAVLLFFSAILWRYSGALRAFAAGRPGALALAFRRLRTYWALLAIGYGVSILFALGAAVLGFVRGIARL